MVNYNNSIIYKLCCKTLNVKDIYIGSTTNFKQRKKEHKYACTKETSKLYNQKKYQFIRENGGWDNWDMIMIKEFNCENKRQLDTEERKQIEELNATLNQLIPTRTVKEYKKNNEQKIKEQYKIYSQKYYTKNKEKEASRRKKYYDNNREIILTKGKEYKKIRISCKCCKTELNKTDFARHKRSKRHIKNSC